MERALRPGNSINGTARMAGVPKATFYKWVQQARMGDVSSRKKKRGRPRKSSRWSAAEKLRLLSEAAKLEGEQLGAFMRREGLHEADLEEMRAAALAGLEPSTPPRGPSPEERRIQELERELRRKDKALAEAAALLVLQKKFHALFSEEEGDGTGGTNEND